MRWVLTQAHLTNLSYKSPKSAKSSQLGWRPQGFSAKADDPRATNLTDPSASIAHPVASIKGANSCWSFTKVETEALVCIGVSIGVSIWVSIGVSIGRSDPIKSRKSCQILFVLVLMS